MASSARLLARRTRRQSDMKVYSVSCNEGANAAMGSVNHRSSISMNGVSENIEKHRPRIKRQAFTCDETHHLNRTLPNKSNAMGRGGPADT